MHLIKPILPAPASTVQLRTRRLREIHRCSALSALCLLACIACAGTDAPVPDDGGNDGGRNGGDGGGNGGDGNGGDGGESSGNGGDGNGGDGGNGNGEPCEKGGDTDGDGLCNLDDVCPLVADDQTDSNGDGVGDACECLDVRCAAPDVCQAKGRCEPSTGECVYATAADGTSCDDGNLCTETDSCQAGVCTGADPIVCEALDACHAVGSCNPDTGECNKSTVDDGTQCEDGNLCTTDSCQSGVCTPGEARSCPVADQCHNVGVCDPNSGECSETAVNDGTICNDGSLCTTGDSCLGGVCTAGLATVCIAQDECHDVGICDPNSGVCNDPVVVDGLSCNDNDACTESDSCQAGICGGAEVLECTANQITIDWDNPQPVVTYQISSELGQNGAFMIINGVEIESWAINDYNTDNAVFDESHDHIGNHCLDDGDDCAEDQHAFGAMLQGFSLRLVGGGSFDLVSLDYRIRDDSGVDTSEEVSDHVNRIPDLNNLEEQLWFGTSLTVAASFTTIDVGPDVEQLVFENLVFTPQNIDITSIQNVTQLFITSTANVSFDNIVLRRR